MSILDCVKVLLRRELSDEECKVLRHLSVQGLAKLNYDIIRGVELEVTMAIFRVVYRRMEKRREQIFSQLAPEVRAAVEKLNRTATAEELIFLNDCYDTNLFKNLIDPDGKLLENFDLENSAVAYLYSELGVEADRLRSGLQAGLARNARHMGPTAGKPATSMKCTVCHLAPMACPISFTSATMVRTNEFHRMSIGFSPMVAWFNSGQTEPLLLSPDSVHLLLTRSQMWPSSPYCCSPRTDATGLTHDSVPSSLGLSCSSTVSTNENEGMGPQSPTVCHIQTKEKKVRFRERTGDVVCKVSPLETTGVAPIPPTADTTYKRGPSCQPGSAPHGFFRNLGPYQRPLFLH